jgi:WD40 repeat protein
MRILKGHRGPVRAVAYAPDDGETLASLGGEGAVLLWNLPRGESWARFPCGSADRAELLFSPDGNRLIVAAGYPRVLDVVGERWAGALIGTALGYQSLAFALDGRALAGAQLTAQQPGAAGWLEVLQWLPAAPQPAATWWEGNYCQRWDEALVLGGATVVAWAPDGRTLAAAYDGRRVGLWDFDPAAPGLLAPRFFRVNPYGRRPAPLAKEGGRPLAFRKEWKARNPVERLAFLPGPDLVLAVAAGPTVELWDAARRKRRRVITCRPGPLRALAVSPDGRLLLTGGRDGTVRLWDVATGAQHQAFDWGLGAIHALAFAPDGMTAAAGGDKPDVVVWDVDEA